MGKQKEYIGTVTSDKMQKTVIVRVSQLSKHSKYNRIIRSFNKFKAHDENGVAKIGDEVRIRETRPLSKDKRYRVVEIVKRAAIPEIEIKQE